MFNLNKSTIFKSNIFRVPPKSLKEWVAVSLYLCILGGCGWELYEGYAIHEVYYVSRHSFSRWVSYTNNPWLFALDFSFYLFVFLFFGYLLIFGDLSKAWKPLRRD